VKVVRRRQKKILRGDKSAAEDVVSFFPLIVKRKSVCKAGDAG